MCINVYQGIDVVPTHWWTGMCSRNRSRNRYIDCVSTSGQIRTFDCSLSRRFRLGLIAFMKTGSALFALQHVQPLTAKECPKL